MNRYVEQVVEIATSRVYDGADVKAVEIPGWLKEDYGLGRGHGMTRMQKSEKGPQIDTKHVGAPVHIGMTPTRCD